MPQHGTAESTLLPQGPRGCKLSSCHAETSGDTGQTDTQGQTGGLERGRVCVPAEQTCPSKSVTAPPDEPQTGAITGNRSFVRHCSRQERPAQGHMLPPSGPSLWQPFLTDLRTQVLSLICTSHTSCVNKPGKRISQTSSQ